MNIYTILNHIIQTPTLQRSVPSSPREINFGDSDDEDFMQSRRLFGCSKNSKNSKNLIEFNNFIKDYKEQYDIHLEYINKKTANIIKTLYDNYLVDDDCFIRKIMDINLYMK